MSNMRNRIDDRLMAGHSKARTRRRQSRLAVSVQVMVAIVFTCAMLQPVHAAVYTCTSTPDATDPSILIGDVACLKNAIIAANANAGDDTINLAGGVYTLTVDPTIPALNGPNGLPSITSVITISGPVPDGDPNTPDAATTIVRDPSINLPSGALRLLHVSASGRLTLRDIKVGDRTDAGVNRGGLAVDGGGIRNAGSVTLFRSQVLGNAAFQGGGVFNTGTLTVDTSRVSNNFAEQNPGAPSTTGVGGGILNAGSGRTVITNNSAIDGNSARVRGGGLANEGGTVQLTNSSFASNFALNLNGAGGGLQNNNGTVTLSNCSFANNGGYFGGAIQNFRTTGVGGTLRLSSCIIGGDEDLGVPGNQAFDGGGIHNLGGGVTLSLTGITGNTAANPNGMGGGGIWNGGGGTVSITFFSQVAGNTPNNCTGVAC